MKLEYFKDTIGIYPGALDQSLCGEMIEEFHRKRDSNVYEGFTLGGKNHKMKRTNELNLKNTGVTLYDEWVEVIEEVAIRLNKRYLKKFGHLEKFNPLQVHGEGVYYPLWKIQEYKKNQGHYHAWHTEQNYSRDTAQRLMVSMFYLNDVHKGGETCFPLSDIEVTPEAGTLVTWPAGWPWVHNANVPISNDKFIITSWMCADWWYDLEFTDEAAEKHNDGNKKLNWQYGK
tara:strand:- start:117 stop:806 length:690 start_codon:yes stop_codon:yes gene_type:complete